MYRAPSSRGVAQRRMKQSGTNEICFRNEYESDLFRKDFAITCGLKYINNCRVCLQKKQKEQYSTHPYKL